MPSADSQLPQNEDPQAEQHCADCGYLLVGLRAEGICPECGLAYDNKTIQLRGWQAGKAPNWGDTWPGQLTLGAVVVGVITGIAVLAGNLGALGTAGTFLLAVAIVAVVILDRRRQLGKMGEPPTRVEASCYGLGQRDGPGRVRLQRWTPKMSVGMRRTWTGRHRLTIADTAFLSTRLQSRVIDFVFESEPARAREVLRQLKQWQDRWEQRERRQADGG